MADEGVELGEVNLQQPETVKQTPEDVTQRMPIFVPSLYSKEAVKDENKVPILFPLSILQRIFVCLDDPRSCLIGIAFSSLMMIVIVISCINYIIATIPSFKSTPDTCVHPVCDNESLCPNTTVCEPIPPVWSGTLELACVSIFTIDYGLRCMLIVTMPDRLLGYNEEDDSEFKNLDDDISGADDNDILELAKKKMADSRRSALLKVSFLSNMLYGIGHCWNSFIKAYCECGEKKNRKTRSLRRSVSGAHYINDSDGALIPWYHKLTNYILSPINIIDALSILPFYAQLLSNSGANSSSMSVIRVLRLARIFRILKVGKNSQGIVMLASTMIKASNALFLVAFFVTLGIVFFGSIIYFFEGGTFRVTSEYPNGAYLVKSFEGGRYEETMFISIPVCMYWAVVTSSTVGYGELAPTTTGGRIVACICMYYGVLLMALPITVIGNNFSKEFEKYNNAKDDEMAKNCLTEICEYVVKDMTNLCSGIDSREDTTYIHDRVVHLVTMLDNTQRDTVRSRIRKYTDEKSISPNDDIQPEALFGTDNFEAKLRLLRDGAAALLEKMK